MGWWWWTGQGSPSHVWAGGLSMGTDWTERMDPVPGIIMGTDMWGGTMG